MKFINVLDCYRYRTSCPLSNHVRLAGGSAGGDVQFARSISPTEYQLFCTFTIGPESGKSFKYNMLIYMTIIIALSMYLC